MEPTVKHLFDELREALKKGPVCDPSHDRRPGQRTCTTCHAAYMRDWRITHELKGTARKKAIARSYAHVYLRRGKLTKGPCEHCGSEKSQMHHPDYDKPLEITWLCRRCHLALHRAMTPRAGV